MRTQYTQNGGWCGKIAVPEIANEATESWSLHSFRHTTSCTLLPSYPIIGFYQLTARARERMRARARARATSEEWISRLGFGPCWSRVVASTPQPLYKLACLATTRPHPR